MIAIVDYGMGNLRSVEKALEFLGAAPVVTRDAKTIARADALILPGVGAFAAAMANLSDLGLIDPILKSVDDNKPFLGICLGMQLLAEKSYEYGVHEGLGIVKGKVVRFEDTSLKIPQMGWNLIDPNPDCPIFADVKPADRFYFVHSYYMVCDDDSSAAETEYGIRYTSAVRKGNVFATQFHPEKSGDAGLSVLKRFSEVKS